MVSVQLRDLNFEKDIGANSILLNVGPFSLVVDAGMDPKRVGKSALPNYGLLKPNSVDLILLTHCHLDHLGSLPILAQGQPKAEILLSYPASLIAPIMLENSFTVMCRQKEEQAIPEYPLYTKKDIEKLIQKFRATKFGIKNRIQKGKDFLDITFFPAGHVVGAASIFIQYQGKNIFLTGDILFCDQLTLKGARFPVEAIDTLILETTRGSTERTAHRQQEEKRLLKTISKTIQRGGTCLLPVFAFGRMQEMLQLFYRARKEKELPECPIFCSGLGMSLVNTFDEIGKQTGLVHFNKKILKALKIKSLGRKKIAPGVQLPSPAIYLLSSGMLVENTPSYKVCTCLLHDSKNTVCFVGYCDPDTPGGKLLTAVPEEEFLFEDIDFRTPLKAEVVRFDLSGHADREELYAFCIEKKAKQIFLTHGEKNARQWFMDKFKKEQPQTVVVDPSPGQLYTL